MRSPDDLVILQRIQNEEVIVATGGSGHTCSHIHRDLGRAHASLLRLNDDDPIIGSGTINRSRRRILQDLDGLDIVGIQPVDIGVLNGRPVDDVERIVVLERTDTPDSDGAS